MVGRTIGVVHRILSPRAVDRFTSQSFDAMEPRSPSNRMDRLLDIALWACLLLAIVTLLFLSLSSTM